MEWNARRRKQKKFIIAIERLRLDLGLSNTEALEAAITWSQATARVLEVVATVREEAS